MPEGALALQIERVATKLWLGSRFLAPASDVISWSTADGMKRRRSGRQIYRAPLPDGVEIRCSGDSTCVPWPG